jgi:FSR family fosmidomycin resistance protein-like MFS transporter
MKAFIADNTTALGRESEAPKALPAVDQAQGFVLRIVVAIAFAHLLNDAIQAMVSASYPMLKDEFALSFTEIGLIALVYQTTASLLQPGIGLYTDKHPKPYLLAIGMMSTMAGIVLLAFAGHFSLLLVAAALIGVGSSTFHPEASRTARMAAGGRYGTAQSLFQMGGNAGSALGALMAAVIVIPHGQRAIGTFAFLVALAIAVLLRVANWRLSHATARKAPSSERSGSVLNRGQTGQALAVIALLMFAKFIYIAAFTNYFTFYLIERFDISVQASQFSLFAFLGAVALGTLAGGPVGDRIGRKAVIWVSFMGVAPFALLLPYVGLSLTIVLVILIGLVMSSAFSALVVYAQEAVPGRVGLISGIMYGLMFGIGGIGAAGLGYLADTNGIVWVYRVCSFLPLLGIATIYLPSTSKRARRSVHRLQRSVH